MYSTRHVPSLTPATGTSFQYGPWADSQDFIQTTKFELDISVHQSPQQLLILDSVFIKVQEMTLK